MHLVYPISMRKTENMRRAELGGLRAVATLEFCKGILAALVSWGLISLSRSDRDLSDVLESALRDLRIGPDAHFAKVLLDAASKLDGVNLFLAAMIVFGYAALRFVEAYGLWRARVWGEWMALLTGMIYLPLEVHHLVRRPGALAWATLSINLAIVLYMAYLRFASDSAGDVNTGGDVKAGTCDQISPLF
jgi:uncharacterized membrane protein (DUF2068 family)